MSRFCINMFCLIFKAILFLIILLLAPITNIWLLVQDQYRTFLIISCLSTLVGAMFIILWCCSNVFFFKCISFICFVISLVFSSFQFGREMPLPTERFVLMVLNVLGIVFYAGLAFLVERQKNKIYQQAKVQQAEVEIYKVDILTGKRLDTL